MLRPFLTNLIWMLGIAAISWAAVVLPLQSRWSPVRDAAVMIQSGIPFNLSDLRRLDAQAEAVSSTPGWHPEADRAAALISLQLAQVEASRGESETAQSSLTNTQAKLEGALKSCPSDSYLWLALYFLRSSRFGVNEREQLYLRQSYITAPYEGWIAVSRNRFGLSVYSLLDSDLKARVGSEFAAMVDSMFLDEVVQNLTSVGWPIRDELLANLDAVGVVPREALAKKLINEGVKVRVPGVELEERGWFR